MKRNISIYIFAAAFAVSVPSMAVAQNLDPTVEVNKTYEGKLIEVHKPSIEMAVPDSVLRFDLDFDYSVFENPYKGAYEFKPYVTDMQPVEGASARKSLYLKAGAGLRPVTLSPMPYLDMVWAPVMNNAFKMNVYAGHESFFGRYLKMPGYDPAAPADVLRLNGEASRENYDMQTRAGVDARYDWDEGVAKVDLGYFGLGERYEERNGMFNSLNVSAYAASKDWGQLFNYEAGASYSFGGDRLEYMDADPYRLAEHDLKVSGRLKASLMENHMMSFELGVDNTSYSGNCDCGVSRLVFAPSYHFTLDRLDVDAGFSIEALVPGSKSDMFATKGQYIYPDVTVSYQLIQDAMRAYAHVGGGTEVNTFSSLLKDNHHIDLFSGAGAPLMDNTVESVSASLGLKGRAGAVFAYHVKGGFSDYANSLFDKVYVGSMPGSKTVAYMPGVGYAAYRKAYAAADLVFEKDGFKVDGNVEYRYSWFSESKGHEGLFLPASLVGSASVEYNWSRRVYLGLDCMFSTGRKGTVLYPDGSAGKVSVPGYADLGVNFEYLASRKFSFWFRGGNLLNMAVQRNLLYAEKGPYLAVGICLNL